MSEIIDASGDAIALLTKPRKSRKPPTNNRVMGPQELARRLSGQMRKELPVDKFVALAKVYIELRGWRAKYRAVSQDDDTADDSSRLEQLEKLRESHNREAKDNGQ